MPPARSAPSQGLYQPVEPSALLQGLGSPLGRNKGNWTRGLHCGAVLVSHMPTGGQTGGPGDLLPRHSTTAPRCPAWPPPWCPARPSLTHLAPPPALGPRIRNKLRVCLSGPAQLPAHSVPTLSSHPSPKHPVTRGWHLQLHPCLRSWVWAYTSNTMTQDNLTSLLKRLTPFCCCKSRAVLVKRKLTSQKH